MNLTKEQCEYLINLAESKDEWKRIRFGVKTSYRTVVLALEDGDIKNLIIEYCKTQLNIDIINLEVGIIKYFPGDVFARHIDMGGTKHTKDFIYNINVLLNDDYEGGEFYLNDVPYPKPMGEIYHYKSNEYHEVKKITKGTRYSALFFLRFRDLKKDTTKIKSVI